MKFPRFFNWHFLLGLLYLGQAAALFFAEHAIKGLDLTFLSRNDLTGSLQTTYKAVYDLPLLAIFLVLMVAAGLIHFLLAFKPELMNLKQRFNPWRWSLIAIVCSLTTAVTALLLGISDLAYLLALILLMLIFSDLGLADEYLKTSPARAVRQFIGKKGIGRLSLQSLIVGLQKMAGLLAWGFIGLSLLATFLNTESLGWHYLIYALGLSLPLAVLVFSRLMRKQTFRQLTLEIASSCAICVLTSAWLWLTIFRG